jgi:hypothetical protein
VNAAKRIHELSYDAVKAITYGNSFILANVRRRDGPLNSYGACLIFWGSIVYKHFVPTGLRRLQQGRLQQAVCYHGKEQHTNGALPVFGQTGLFDHVIPERHRPSRVPRPTSQSLEFAKATSPTP